MYEVTLYLHSWIRWLLVFALLYSLISSGTALASGRPWTKANNIARGSTSGFAYLQLIIGLILYTVSPLIKVFMRNKEEVANDSALSFFGIYHVVMAIIAIVLLTIGGVKAKKALTDAKKHKMILIWFGLAAVVLLAAIPWPFHPLAAREWFRF